MSPERSAVRDHPLLLVAAVAIALRVVVAVALGDRAQAVSGAADQVSYDTLAQRVLTGHGFSFPTLWYPFTPPDEHTAHWSYAYTLYLAAVYAVVGHHPLAARLLQTLAAALICVLLHRLGARLFEPAVGLSAAALSAVYAYLVFFGAVLMTQTFYTALVLASLERALATADRPTQRNWVALGLLLGAGALLRQTLLLFSPLLLLWTAWRDGRPRRWGGTAAAVAALALCIAPWTLYNHAVFGDFLLLNSNGGWFAYAGNAASRGTHFDPNYVPPLPPALVDLAEPARDRALYRAAAAEIARDPRRFALLTLDRVPEYFWLLPSARSSALSNAARLLSFTLLAPFMLYGLWLSRRRWHVCLPLYLYVLFDALLHVTTWAAPRYRLPSDAVLLVFAGAAVVDIARRLGLVDPQSQPQPQPQPAAIPRARRSSSTENPAG